MSGLLSALDNLLVRIQGKIESRTRKPWFDLQRSYFYRDRQAVKSIPELCAALEHFHVLLSDSEYDLLFHSFKNHNSFFDFKSFAARLYPKEAGFEVIREGRVVETYVPPNGEATLNRATQSADAAIVPAYYSSAPSAAQTFVMNPASTSPYQYATHPSSQSQPMLMNSLSSSSSSSAPLSLSGPMSPAFAVSTMVSPTKLLSSAGAAIMTSDVDVPRLGETLGPNGTTTYYKSISKKNTSNKSGSGVGSGSNSNLLMGSNKSKRRSASASRSSSRFVPRLTYNRGHYQRYNESEYEDYLSGLPVPQPYPEEEFKQHGQFVTTLGHARFERKSLPDFVEVSRRFNISRSYNTKTGKHTQ